MNREEVGAEIAQKWKSFVNLRNAFFQGRADERMLMEETTQPFWQSLRLSRKRLAQKGVTTEVTFEPDKSRITGEAGEISVESDGVNVAGRWTAEGTACRSYYQNGKRIYRKKDSEIWTANFLKSDVQNEQVCCPNCGYVGTITSFIDGCDACGTKFSVHDFETKVSGFSMEENVPRKTLRTMKQTMIWMGIAGAACLVIGIVAIVVLVLMLLVGHDTGTDVVGMLVALLFSQELFPALGRSVLLILMLYGIGFGAVWVFRKSNIEGDYIVRAQLPGFSGTEFFQNLEYKLRSICLTDGGKGGSSFVKCPIEAQAARYKDVIDCDMTHLSMGDVTRRYGMIYMEAEAKLRLTRLRQNRIRTAYEKVGLSMMCREDVAEEKVSAIRMYRCDNCGSSIDILEGSTCAYCGTQFDYADYGWVISRIEPKKAPNRYLAIRVGMILAVIFIFGLNILLGRLTNRDEDTWDSVIAESMTEGKYLNECFAEVVMPEEVWADAVLVDTQETLIKRDYRYQLAVTTDTLAQYEENAKQHGFTTYTMGPSYLGMWKRYTYEEEVFFIRLKLVTKEDGLLFRMEMVTDLNEDAQTGLSGGVAPLDATDTDNATGAVSDEASVTMVMVGDILLHDAVEESAREQSGEYDFSALFSHTADEIAQADVALVNQEVIIGGKELRVSGYPAFNAPYAIGDELVETGFDVICQGTNHALDRGEKGIRNCLAFWKTNYPEITVLGIHDSEEDAGDMFVYEQNGIKIAILNYTYGTNGIALPADMPYAVDLLDEEKVVADIQKAEQLADFTVVCPHWGTEYRLNTDAMQEKWTQIFLENGVDLVIGTHPHVIEPIEWVRDEATGNEMLVYYSLGNYVNWTSGTGAGTADRMVGGMAEITIAKNADGAAEISDYGVKALVCHLEDGFGGVTVYNVSDYSPELAKENQIVAQDNAFSYDYVVELCDQVWGDTWE